MQVLYFKCGNLDKFKSRSSDGILLHYTPHDRFIVCLTLRLTPLLSYVM
jgi:hypothetical protein